MQRLLIACLGCLVLTSCTANAPVESIDVFFDRFTADWVRMNPNQAISTRYFTGPEQDGRGAASRNWRHSSASH